MDHLYLTAPKVSISLTRITEEPPENDTHASAGPCSQQHVQHLYQYKPLIDECRMIRSYAHNMKCAAVSSYAAMHGVEDPSTMGVWAEHGLGSLRSKNDNHRWSFACAVLVLQRQPPHEAASPPTDECNAHRTSVVPVYLFHNYAPAQPHTHLQPMLAGVCRAPWKNAGLTMLDLEEVGPDVHTCFNSAYTHCVCHSCVQVRPPWTTRPEPLHLGMPHAGLVLETLAPPGEPRIVAMVVHTCLQPKAKNDMPPTVMTNFVSTAIEDALKAVRTSCPGEFRTKTELRLGEALPALASALANIAARSEDPELQAAATKAADMKEGCKLPPEELSHSLMVRLQVALWKEHHSNDNSKDKEGVTAADQV